MMAVQSPTDPPETGHVIADVQALFVVAVVLGVSILRAGKTCSEFFDLSVVVSALMRQGQVPA
jgi:hypothetical protein